MGNRVPFDFPSRMLCTCYLLVQNHDGIMLWACTCIMQYMLAYYQVLLGQPEKKDRPDHVLSRQEASAPGQTVASHPISLVRLPVVNGYIHNMIRAID